MKIASPPAGAVGEPVRLTRLLNPVTLVGDVASSQPLDTEPFVGKKAEPVQAPAVNVAGEAASVPTGRAT